MARNSPFEPPADLRQWAQSMHDMFVSLVDADFTEDQALKFLAAFMVEAGRNADDDS